MIDTGALLDAAAEGLPLPNVLEAAMCWQLAARSEQLRPEGCRTWWNVQAGRGFGKTRLGTEHTLDVCEDWGPHLVGGIGNKNTDDIRTLQIEGHSGLIECATRRGYEVKYEANKKRVLHPSGAVLHLYSGEVKGATRGFSGNYFWADELPHWTYAQECWDNIGFAMREQAPEPGPHGIITSTPVRRSIISRLLVSDLWRERITTTRGTMYDNIENLAADMVQGLVRAYGGSWKGQQELEGVLIEDGASFSKRLFDDTRVIVCPSEMRRLCISVDPAAKSKANSDSTGIVAVASGGAYEVLHMYVLADRSLEQAGPTQWADAALDTALELSKHYRIPAEIYIEDNQGGEMAEQVVRMRAQHRKVPCPPIIRHTARESKVERADAAAVLYETLRVHHVGTFDQLEQQMVEWVPGSKSPDRMDALVHGVLRMVEDEVVGSLV